jgi:hypothetical protein
VGVVRKGLLLLATVLAVTAATLSSPAVAADGDGLSPRGNILITSNTQFDPEHGIVGGSGTASNPYVISGWDVSRVEIKDTSKHVLISNNQIDRLVLDWIGPGVHVLNNKIGDLRVNQNVKRTGEMTSGVIANNTFEVVGQLRHWDGVFEHNQVGNPSSCADIPFFSCRAVNFDGFNGSRFRNNNIYGYVEVRLHGHHHSSSFSDHSHYHGTHHEDMVDHTKRYHQVWVTNNTIHSGDYYGLLYTDSNHAGNDRTATSETNPDLNKPHVHTTKVNLTGNKVYGAGIQVNIFNADDERHLGTKTGSMKIKNNKVFVQQADFEADDTFSSKDGIAISQANDVNLSIVGNTVDGSYGETDVTTDIQKRFDYGSGIYLWDLNQAKVKILDNTVIDRTYGVHASSMSDSVKWWIAGLRTSGVEDDVYYDNSVKNEPERRRS